MLNPFLNGHKSSIILSSASGATEKAYIQRKQDGKTKKEQNLFSLLDKELGRQRELQVTKTFELVA